MQNNHENQGIWVHPRMDRQTHQQFLDETMLMGHPYAQESRNIKTCLINFGKASGMEVNEQKSLVFFFNTPQITRRNICRILGFQEISLPSKYLGGPLENSKVRKGSWLELLEKMRKCLTNWTIWPLNFASRLILVKSILQAMLVYLFSALATPKASLK